MPTPTCYIGVMGRQLHTAYKAGAAYFATVFALGFVLGTLRVLWLVPMVGETNAVLAEQPVMLIASWFAAGWLVGRYRLASVREKAIMGVIAFLMLMLAEVTLASLLFGQPPAAWLGSLFAMPGIIGLAGQTLFALMPLFVRRGRQA
ncbi:hypothetical protein [Sphingorhabdus sp.]|uniref:hypothetical protein n=1 Tax=Sphingorhabdus sp. TaxID=1902408 RepID=UPI003918924A